jgi:phage gp36-like protein
MAYCNVEDVRRVLTGTRDVEEKLTANSLDNDQIEYAIAGADAQIDTELRKRYKVPPSQNGVLVTDFAVQVPMLHHLSVEISKYLCMLIYRSGREFANALDATILGYNRATAVLTGIQDGSVQLPIDELGSSPDSDDVLTVFNQYDGPLFPSHNIFGAPEGTIPPDWTYR